MVILNRHNFDCTDGQMYLLPLKNKMLFGSIHAEEQVFYKFVEFMPVISIVVKYFCNQKHLDLS